MGGGEVIEIRGPADQGRGARIVPRYHKAQAKVAPFDVIEFRRQSHAGPLIEMATVAQRRQDRPLRLW